ncbi:MAG TPA: hypothetical protein PK629_07435 [Oscillospiraceae bacterium]|nr:hypothetical protein [Oscillospiraceae bacterium]HPF56036.1 hypothetical protein [Clostridiales bacterium]HPK35033.1 hypothetical protein [Oscillospiraceae bacterium]HPR76282.1 hypothetical protein [Oscillospiraceae bacterium]
MKKVIESVIALIACVLLLLDGCASALNNSLPGELAGQENNYPETLEIIAPTFFWDTADRNAETAKQQWQDEMLARYGVQITVYSNTYTESGTPVMTGANKNRDVFSGKEKFSGLVQIEAMNTLQSAIDRNFAVPLEDYLVDNAVWNALPDEIKSTFSVNGHIYAVPTFVSYHMRARVFQKDLFEQTGIDVTDLNSLKEFGTAYAQSTGHYTISSDSFFDMNDVMNAFGLYTQMTNGFSYDPTENCYVDFLTKGAAVDALEYLRELYQVGALNCDFQKPTYDMNTASHQATYGLYNPDNYNEVLTLNPQYPQVLNNYVNGFYMTKDTVQPKETINFFVNMLFGSEQNYLDCWLGSSDGYVLNSDGTITMNMVQNADGSYTAPAMPKLTGGFPDFFPYSDANILYSQDGVVTNNSEIAAGKINKDYEVLSDALDKGTVVKISPAYSIINNPSYYTNYNDICALFEHCIKDALTRTDYTIQQIVDDYKQEMLNLGGNRMLDEMNAAIGKQTAYYYG